MATKKTTQTEQPVEQTTEQPAEATTEATAEAPAEQEVEQPVEQHAEAPAEQEVEQPVEQHAEAPAEQPATQEEVVECKIKVYNEIGQRLLAMHPTVNEVYVTSDGYAFLSLNAAQNNARNLSGHKVFIVKRNNEQSKTK